MLRMTDLENWGITSRNNIIVNNAIAELFTLKTPEYHKMQNYHVNRKVAQRQLTVKYVSRNGFTEPHNNNCLQNFQLNKCSGKLSDWNKLINLGMSFNRNQPGRGKFSCKGENWMQTLSECIINKAAESHNRSFSHQHPLRQSCSWCWHANSFE